MPVHITPHCNMAEVCLKPFQKMVGNSTPAWSQNSLNNFFCETPISNTNNTFFFCFGFLRNKVSGSLCYNASLWEQETLYHREVLQFQSTVLNQGTLAGLKKEQYKTTWNKGEGCQKHLGLVFYFELIFCRFMSRNL